MTTYIVTSRGNVVGEYEGETPQEALKKMAEDAGYGSIEELCNSSSSREEDFQVFESD